MSIKNQATVTDPAITLKAFVEMTAELCDCLDRERKARIEGLKTGDMQKVIDNTKKAKSRVEFFIKSYRELSTGTNELPF